MDLVVTVVVLLRPEAVDLVGGITDHVLVNRLHHRDVTMYRLPVVAADGIGTPVPALAVSHQPQHQLLHPAGELAVEDLPAVGPVLRATIGCLIMVDGVCLMEEHLYLLPVLRLHPVLLLLLPLHHPASQRLLLPAHQLLPHLPNPLPPPVHPLKFVVLDKRCICKSKMILYLK